MTSVISTFLSSYFMHLLRVRRGSQIAFPGRHRLPMGSTTPCSCEINGNFGILYILTLFYQALSDASRLLGDQIQGSASYKQPLLSTGTLEKDGTFFCSQGTVELLCA